MNNLYFILLTLIIGIYIVIEVRNKKFNIKESFYWVLLSVLMLLLAIFPYSIDVVAKWLKIDYPPSLLFVLCILFLLFINFRSSKKISEMQERLVELEQNLALLKKDVKDINDKHRKK